MNRNAESHFAQLPHANIERSRFDRSHSVKFTGNVGQVIPFLCDPVLPGDTWEIDTSKVLRLQTLLSPVYDNCFLDTYYFYVPNRLVWDHWKEFCGENTQSAWYPTVQYSIPKITIPYSGVAVGSILDYLGIPPESTINAVKVNALRVRGYSLIIDQWFRDQNLQNPLTIYTGDNDVAYNAASCETGGAPFVACKTHDYFTSCLPGPQKSQYPVNIPVGGQVAVKTASALLQFDQPTYPLWFDKTTAAGSSSSNKWSSLQQVTNVGGTTISTISAGSNTGDAGLAPINLVADSNPNNTAGSYFTVNVNDLRLAFQTQKFLEKQARGGSRYREILLSHFGVHSPDARQQVPEYLGGNRIPLNVSQVVNAAESSGNRLGNVGAYSLTTDVHHDVFKSFTEHGYIYGLMVVRYDHTYSQGAEYDWWIDDVYDIYWPVFACISEQPVRSKEIYYKAAGSGQDPVFGYQEAWASYRYKANRVCAEMRPMVSNGLYSWSFSDAYSQMPTLSSSWIAEDKANVDRALAIQSSVSNQFWSDFYVKCTVTRPMPLYSIPGLVDHF